MSVKMKWMETDNEATEKKEYIPWMQRYAAFSEDGRLISINLPFNEEGYRKIQDYLKRKREAGITRSDMELQKTEADTTEEKSLKESIEAYTDKKVTAKELRGLADWLCERHTFLYIEDMALYIYWDGYYQHLTYSLAPRIFNDTLYRNGIRYPLRSADYKELIQMILANRRILKKPEDCRTNKHLVLFSDGALDVREGRMRASVKEDYQFSKIDAPLEWGNWHDADDISKDFVRRFCGYDSRKEKYLWELVGYLLSGYQKKLIVFFIGPGNSGKSTLANMVKRICGQSNCVSLGIRDLAGDFSLAELHGKRLCIDSDMDATVLNEKDLSLLKKVVGNDLIMGNRKFEQMFYFQSQAKFLICANDRIRICNRGDDMPILKRLKVFELADPVPDGMQSDEIDWILDRNRTYFIQQAMLGLCRLVRNNFRFTCDVSAEGYVENVTDQSRKRTEAIHGFVEECCEFGEDYMEPVGRLYERYKQYVENNAWERVGINIFSETLSVDYREQVTKERTHDARVFRGIRLTGGESVTHL